MLTGSSAFRLDSKTRRSANVSSSKPSETALIAIAFVFTGGQALSTLSMVWVPTEGIPPRYAATTIGLASISAEVLRAVGSPALGGWLAQRNGLEAALLICAGGAFLVFLGGLALKSLCEN
jgi:hypothetical protein